MKLFIGILTIILGIYYTFKSIVYLVTLFSDHATEIAVKAIEAQGLSHWIKYEAADRLIRDLLIAVMFILIGISIFYTL